MKMDESEGSGKGGGGRGAARPRTGGAPKLCYSVPEAAELLGFSRNFGYELARTGQLPIVRFGKRMVVPKAPFDRMLGLSPEREAEE